MTNEVMNPQKTAGEAAFAAQFADLRRQGAFAESGQERGLLPHLAAREAALAELEQFGLPTRKAESWHYTDLRRILAHITPFAENSGGAVLPALLPQANLLTLINGKAQPCSPRSAPAEEAVRAVSLAENSRAESGFAVFDAAETPGAKSGDKGNAVGLINTAFAKDGWHIDVSANAGGSDEIPVIELQNIQNGGQAHGRFPVHIGKGARATVIERQIGDNQECFLSFISELHMEEDAEATWIIIRERGLGSAELNRFQAVLGKNAKLKLYVINAGGQFLRQEINVDLAGEEANFQLRGINLLSGKSHTDTTMSVRHLVENTASVEIFRNVAAEEARGVFQGMIRVGQIAQKTDARMACNSLILSDKAEFNAKPELEIFADDVACGHGATVTEIDHDHLFYLMARGIPEGEARALLIKAFTAELIEELPEDLAASLHNVLETWLQAHFQFG